MKQKQGPYLGTAAQNSRKVKQLNFWGRDVSEIYVDSYEYFSGKNEKKVEL